MVFFFNAPYSNTRDSTVFNSPKSPISPNGPISPKSPNSIKKRPPAIASGL